ncbi:MAG: methionine biosynthesis protein MetW [Candidatus Bathyarchaeum tardum]|nr:MAG: methionine biosynthesis protein MetW [Candidatus Bathyarchaeum tardum]
MAPRLEHRVIKDWVKKNSTVLDLGCGTGELMKLLINEKQVQAQGIEINEQSIGECVAQGLSVFQQDIDTGLSEYSDDAFDYVILSQTLQQVKKPDFVIKESLRVGKQVIVSFPNFVYYPARFQMFFKGKVPVTPSLPHEWYQTPNLHFLSINDFKEYCKKRNFKIQNSTYVTKNKKVTIFPNFFAEIGTFLVSY